MHWIGLYSPFDWATRVRSWVKSVVCILTQAVVGLWRPRLQRCRGDDDSHGEWFSFAITVERVLATDEQTIRGVGLSHPKARAIRGLAELFDDGLLEPDKLAAMSDAEIATELAAVPGIGPSSAQRFLLHCLHRPDIFPAGDLTRRCRRGLRRGAAHNASSPNVAERLGMTRVEDLGWAHHDVQLEALRMKRADLHNVRPGVPLGYSCDPEGLDDWRVRPTRNRQRS